MRTFALLLAPCLALAFPACAQGESRGTFTVEEMIEACELALDRTEGNIDDLQSAAYCAGVLYGVGQAARQNCEAVGWRLLPLPPLVSANPPSPRSVLQAWVNWARDNPAEWDMDFGTSAVTVIVQEFPCES